MNTLNHTFFEKYKSLEKLCRDMYQNNTGVTSYINDMMNTPWRNHCNIANWESDLIQLKRIRSLRNQLAHTEEQLWKMSVRKRTFNLLRISIKEL